ncbi:MAG TPA: hypothetical protein VFQ53_08275 [Kofleriaceae bacterium]|nr:hypothetical protein [Kofleriaceae bacterium]
MKKTVLALVLASTAAYGVWHYRADHHATASNNLVLNRIWIDHFPRNDKDSFNLFVALTQEPLGIFQETSQWKGNYEMFMHETSGNQLHIVYPQSGDRETVTANARECDEGGMDYCMDVEGASRGVKRYYSIEGFEIDPDMKPDDVRARVLLMIKNRK